MDYGHANQTNLAESELVLRRRAMSLAKQGISSAAQDIQDPFASAITPGVGLTPEDVNPDLRSSLTGDQNFAVSPQNTAFLDRSSQMNLGARALEPMLPPEQQPIEIDATRIANYDPTAAPELLNPMQDNMLTQGYISEQPLEMLVPEPEVSSDISDSSSEPTKAIIEVGQHLTGHDVAKVENAIKTAGPDISSLYDLIQNTREEQ